MNKYKGIIFDLDGTLLDTLSDLSDSVNEVLNAYNYPTYSNKEYKEKIGHGFRNLIEQCLPKEATKGLVDESLQLFLTSYDKKYKSKTKPYSGINTLLMSLVAMDIKVAVNSNKRDDYTKSLIKINFPTIPWIDVFGERKNIEKKPNPTAAILIAQKMDLKPSEILYIGDSKTDIITAQNAKMDSVGVLWGFRNEKELKENKATYIVKKPSEILNLVEKKEEENDLEQHATNIRKNIIKMIGGAKSGHPGGSLSGVEILTHLYFKEMNINKENINSIERDRFVLSKGHASPLLYAVLCEKGFIEEKSLNTFRQINSKLQGHPNMNYVEGIDMSTGSLGQGISCAVGMALANKLDKNKHRIYALLGDGECEEGQVWEAAMAAAHYKLDNLCAIVDYNGLQIDGDIKEVMNPTPIDKKFEAFNWNVICIDGHDLEEIKSALTIARKTKGQPTMILANTIKGKGVSFMENNYAWHGSAPNEEQCSQALKELEGE